MPIIAATTTKLCWSFPATESGKGSGYVRVFRIQKVQGDTRQHGWTKLLFNTRHKSLEGVSYLRVLRESSVTPCSYSVSWHFLLFYLATRHSVRSAAGSSAKTTCGKPKQAPSLTTKHLINCLVTSVLLLQGVPNMPSNKFFSLFHLHLHTWAWTQEVRIWTCDSL